MGTFPVNPLRNGPIQSLILRSAQGMVFQLVHCHAGVGTVYMHTRPQVLKLRPGGWMRGGVMVNAVRSV